MALDLEVSVLRGKSRGEEKSSLQKVLHMPAQPPLYVS